MGNTLTRLFLYFALCASILGLIGDVRFFFPNIFLGLISAISYLPLIVVYLSSIPLIIYIFIKKIKKSKPNYTNYLHMFILFFYYHNFSDKRRRLKSYLRFYIKHYNKYICYCIQYIFNKKWLIKNLLII